MLDLEGINYWAVLVAWAVNIGIGAFWYSPAGFGRLWTKYTGVDMMKMEVKEANKTIGFIALSAAVQAVTLAVILNSLYADSVWYGLLAGLVLWFGFVAVTTVGTTLYQRLGWKFWWLNSFYFLVVMSINSVLLTLWK